MDDIALLPSCSLAGGVTAKNNLQLGIPPKQPSDAWAYRRYELVLEMLQRTQMCSYQLAKTCAQHSSDPDVSAASCISKYPLQTLGC